MYGEEILDQGRWLERARALDSEHSKVRDNSTRTFRRLLAELHQLACCADAGLRERFRQLHETTIAAALPAILDAIARERHGWLPPDASPGSAFDAAAKQLRALDVALFRANGAEPASGPDDLLCRIAGQDVGRYVLPVSGPPFRQRAFSNEPFQRRGLVHHRAFPEVVHGMPVELGIAELETLALAEGAIGAAYFPGLVLGERTLPNSRFLVEAVTCDDHAGKALNHVADSDEHGCVITMWPELTMPPAVCDAVVEALDRRSLRDESGAWLYVAGSWHVETEAGWQNRALVLDRYGVTVMEPAKIIPMSFRPKDAAGSSGESRTEAIEPGRRLPLLYTGRQLIGIAICRDFCDLNEGATLRDLALDLILVPSMGNEATVRAHEASAAQFDIQAKPRIAIVQAPNDEPENGIAGWSLDNAAGAAAVEQRKSFVVLEVPEQP